MIERIGKFAFLIVVFSILYGCQRERAVIIESNRSSIQEIGLLYTRLYRLIEHREYDLAFSEAEYFIALYPPEDVSKLDLQNLFAKYIIEGDDGLENVIRNYSRLFRFFSASDAEAIFQMIIYRSHIEADAERAALMVAQMADSGMSEAGIYYFLAYTFYNLKMREQANRYLDCLITIAPAHPATSDLIFRMRGRRRDFRGEAVEALRNLFFKDSSYNSRLTVAKNFHIPSLMNSEWRDIASRLLADRMSYVRLVAFSEIPIFFARQNDIEMLYRIIRDSLRDRDYALFTLALRSLLYVHKEPEVVINRIRTEFPDHPYSDIIYAKYLIAVSPDNLHSAIDLFITALTKENNLEVFMEAVDLFRRSSLLFRFRAFGEELMFIYPYYQELFRQSRIISGEKGDLERYFEHLPESVDRYIIYSQISPERSTSEGYLIRGVRAFPSDCAVIIELMKHSADCKNRGFFEIYIGELKGIIKKENLIRCIAYIDDKRKEDYLAMIESNRRDWCNMGDGEER